MSTLAPPAPSPLAPDGLGIADLVDLLGIDHTHPHDDDVVPARRPVDAVAVVRGWIRRAADWGSGPERSWCAW